MQAAAYIRRSSVSVDSPGEASREAQLTAVRSLCGEDVRVFTDWGVSGLKADRPEYVKLKAAIVAGEIGSVCAYSLSRLGRSARELLDFVELCQSRGVVIRTSVESLDTSTAMGRAMLTVMAAFAQLEAELAGERQASARAARVARGDDMSAGYGYALARQPNGSLRRVPDPEQPLAPLLEAYREAGSVLGACRLLEARGIPAPRGGTRWATSALTRILDANAPDLLPRRLASGRRVPAARPAILARLLRCPFCDRMMTPNVARGQYYCPNGPKDRERHTRYAVREADVLPFVRAEAERFMQRVGKPVAANASRRDAVTARLDRAHELFIAGDIDRPRYDAEKAKVTAEYDQLDAADEIAGVPALAWDMPADRLNGILRTFFNFVELDGSLRPVRADWRMAPRR
jgi:DNA invertase Pin-like site-specific DNA recombinase